MPVFCVHACCVGVVAPHKFREEKTQWVLVELHGSSFKFGYCVRSLQLCCSEAAQLHRPHHSHSCAGAEKASFCRLLLNKTSKFWGFWFGHYRGTIWKSQPRAYHLFLEVRGHNTCQISTSSFGGERLCSFSSLELVGSIFNQSTMDTRGRERSVHIHNWLKNVSKPDTFMQAAYIIFTTLWWVSWTYHDVSWAVFALFVGIHLESISRLVDPQVTPVLQAKGHTPDSLFWSPSLHLWWRWKICRYSCVPSLVFEETSDKVNTLQTNVQQCSRVLIKGKRFVIFPGRIRKKCATLAHWSCLRAWARAPEANCLPHSLQERSVSCNALVLAHARGAEGSDTKCASPKPVRTWSEPS